MKFNKSIIFLTIFISIVSLFSFVSCGSTQKTVNAVSYSSIKFSEFNDFISSNIVYPQFKKKSYSKLDKKIQDFTDSDYKAFKSVAKKEYNGFKFSYYLTSEVFSTNTTISVLCNILTYTGGAHGNTAIKTFNFDVEKNEFMTITKATGKSLKEIAQIVKKDLLKRECDVSSIFESEKCFENFTVSDKNVTIYFEPYEVASYAMGVVEVNVSRN